MDYNKKNSLHLILLKIFESIRIFFNNILEMPFIFLFYRPSKNYTKGKLLLINTGDLGDNILTFNFLKTLTNSNLFNEIHLVVKNPIKSIYNFPNPFYNIIEWKKNKYKFNLFYKIKFINQLQSEKYETVFNITPERGIFNEELTLTSGARNYWKINKSNPYLNSILKSFYDKRYQKNFKINSNNEYELLDEIISQLNLNMNKSPKIENVLYKKKIDEKFIVISPFSSIPAKSWGINNYLLLAEKLSDYCKIYFIGTKEQFYILKDQAIKNQRIKNICGQLELEDIPSFMSNAKLFIGNDSGLTHLALFLKIPLIAIIGGGTFGRFLPYNEGKNVKYFSNKMECFNCNWKCIYKERYCLTMVNVDDVVKESYNILENNDIQNY